MAFKLRSGNETNFKSMGSSPAKQKAEHIKSYPESYTKEDIKFLEEQREDIVRREDLDEAGKKIYDANQAESKAKMKRVDELMKSPGKN